MDETTDLFGREPAQASLFGEADDRIPHVAPPSYVPNPELVRQRLHALLATARGAERMPWDARRAKTFETIFPQMANWLPDDEAEQLRFEFEQEIERLKLAA